MIGCEKNMTRCMAKSSLKNGMVSRVADRIWIYRQIRKRLEIGELYLDNSIRRRRFSDELVSVEQETEALKSLDIPWLRQPLDAELEGLTGELHNLWRSFDCELRQGRGADGNGGAARHAGCHRS